LPIISGKISLEYSLEVDVSMEGDFSSFAVVDAVLCKPFATAAKPQEVYR
jgi:hypothetical protein